MEFRRRNAQYSVLATLAALLSAGCGQTMDSAKSPQTEMNAYDRPVSSPVATNSAPAAPGYESVAPVSSAPGAGGKMQSNAQDFDEQTIKVSKIVDVEPDRYLIKNATVSLETPDVHAATAKLIDRAKMMKGYVSGMHETVDSLGARSETFVVRVPYTQFDLFLNSFEGQGKVLDREVTAEDVTEEFVDTQSKLHNLKATESRLLSHLSQTGKLSDTLLVEKEINRVREEADRLTGRLKFLAHRVSFSTFNVTVKETPHAQAITPAETFSVGKVVSDAARSLVGFGQQVLVFAIWLLMWSVLWLPPLLIVVWVRRRRGGGFTRNA